LEYKGPNDRINRGVETLKEALEYKGPREDENLEVLYIPWGQLLVIAYLVVTSSAAAIYQHQMCVSSATAKNGWSTLCCFVPAHVKFRQDGFSCSTMSPPVHNYEALANGVSGEIG
jgi:hypothetical protein